MASHGAKKRLCLRSLWVKIRRFSSPSNAMPPSRTQRYTAEFTGTAFLLATVIGSGIMAENLADGNAALALLGNAIATGAILFVLITMLGSISGAHFNPTVTLVFALKREISVRDSVAYVLLQTAGGLLGMLLAHAMFELPLLQTSEKWRSGGSQ